MGQLRDFLNLLHRSSKRDYSARATDLKPEHATLAKRFDRDYWDGARETGYGGYVDDGRWARVASRMVEAYGLGPAPAILDVGCGKGFLLKEFLLLRPQATIRGIDVSGYALERVPESVRPFVARESAEGLTAPDRSYDLVVSLNTLHNLELPELFRALGHMERVSRGNSYLCVESYRNEREKWNLMRWQLTCECFYSPREWEWIFRQAGYTGDYEFIYFE